MPRARQTYRLVHAEPERFASASLIYHDGMYRITSKWDWDADLQQRALVARYNRPYWIYAQRKKIGGVVFSSNSLWYPFTIPPEVMSDTLARFLVVQLRKSIGSSRYLIAYVLPSAARHFLANGFRKAMRRVTMVRYNEPLVTTPPQGYILRPPVRSDAKAIASLAYRAFHGGATDRWFAKFNGVPLTRDFYHEMAKGFFQHKPSMLRASSVVHRRGSDEIVGFCLMQVQDGHPFLLDIAVDPIHRGNGLAAAMIGRASTLIAARNQFTSLQVTVGTPAFRLYTRLGFQPLTESWQLYQRMQED